MKQSVSKNKVGLLPVSFRQKYRSLLSKSISSLTPPIQTAGFDDYFEQLHSELSAKGLIHLEIETYFGDEWFCPSQSTAIAIPFWLANHRLMQLEQELVGFVEGGTSDEFMRLLRHEAGHCVDHAYRLSKRRDWQKVFGDPRLPYDPDAKPTMPGHPDFVENLPGGYAQTHPEEDFAETFAVWLATSGDRRHHLRGLKSSYANRPIALKKLLFVDKLMREICEKKPRKLANQKICNARRMRKSLSSYYFERLQHVARTRHFSA